MSCSIKNNSKSTFYFPSSFCLFSIPILMLFLFSSFPCVRCSFSIILHEIANHISPVGSVVRSIGIQHFSFTLSTNRERVSSMQRKCKEKKRLLIFLWQTNFYMTPFKCVVASSMRFQRGSFSQENLYSQPLLSVCYRCSHVLHIFSTISIPFPRSESLLRLFICQLDARHMCIAAVIIAIPHGIWKLCACVGC